MMMPMLRPPAVEIDHRLNSRYRDVRFLPNSGAKADVARRRGCANCRPQRLFRMTVACSSDFSCAKTEPLQSRTVAIYA